MYLLIDCTRIIDEDFLYSAQDAPFDLLVMCCCWCCCSCSRSVIKTLRWPFQDAAVIQGNFTDETFLVHWEATFPQFYFNLKKLIIIKRWDKAFNRDFLMFTCDSLWQVRRLLLPSLIPFTWAHLEMSKMFPFIKSRLFLSRLHRNVKLFVFATPNVFKHSCAIGCEN